MAKRKFRYGFKAEANRYASDFRAELGIRATDPLCPWQLAQHLSVPIVKLSELADCESRRYLTVGAGKNEFHATVCYIDTFSFILNNDSHHIKRQSSDIAHELAHVVLGHPPTPPFDDQGNREFIREIEDEAEWLGPALLVSEPAAIHAYGQIRMGKKTLAQLSDEWTVTEEVIKMRMNVVGASRRFGRAA